MISEFLKRSFSPSFCCGLIQAHARIFRPRPPSSSGPPVRSLYPLLRLLVNAFNSVFSSAVSTGPLFPLVPCRKEHFTVVSISVFSIGGSQSSMFSPGRPGPLESETAIPLPSPDPALTLPVPLATPTLRQVKTSRVSSEPFNPEQLYGRARVMIL